MKENPQKLATLSGDDWCQFEYPNIWCIEQTSSTSRLVAGAKDNHIEHITKLLDHLNDPFGILYVLVASRLGNADGRYQSPYPTSRKETVDFLFRYKDFLERDSRHAIWILTLNNEGTIVYEQHNLIYAYGPLIKYSEYFKSNKFKQGEVEIPSPHSHNYNPEFDQDEDKILKHWDWKRFDLIPEIDDP